MSDASADSPHDATRDSTRGLIVVDHGSRRAESNELLAAFVDTLAAASPDAIVEAAHMELADPSIATAVDRCVARGAKQLVVFPYFLSPGRHWHEDIPQLVAAAVSRHPQITFLVTAPFGLHPLMAEVMQQRIDHCIAHAAGQADRCDVCQPDGDCAWRL